MDFSLMDLFQKNVEKIKKRALEPRWVIVSGVTSYKKPLLGIYSMVNELSVLLRYS